MSDLFEQNQSKDTVRGVCRVAYTLDRTQPVICTYISDQPFFYMDYATDEIEDENDALFFEDGDLFTLTQEIETLKAEVEMYQSEISRLYVDEARCMEEFCENAESLCETFSLSMSECDARLGEVIDVLKRSRVAQAYLDLAQKHFVVIKSSSQVEFGFYDRRNATILINPDMSIVDQILVLSRELRRHWQHKQGVLINPLTFLPENAILVNRAQEADLSAAIIRIGWELQLAGVRDVWARLENSPLADLAQAFAREAYMDFRTINNGIASAAVFESWFLSERCRQQDKKIIQAMLADYKGYIFESQQASKSVTAELISGLGGMPFGKNYLAQHARTIMTDPIFTDVRDRANANFLWFIKFERSFKESEQHLQLESDLSTRDDRHALINDKGPGLTHGNAQGADIIEFKPFQGAARASNKNGERGGAKVIDLRYWSGS